MSASLAFVDAGGPWVWILLAVALLLSALYSGSETGIYAVNRLRLELRAGDPEDRSARRLHSLLARRELLLCVLLLGNNIANELAAIVAGRLTAEWLGHSSFAALYAALLLTPIVFVTGEALPKQLFHSHAESWTFRVAGFLAVSRWLLMPLAILVLPIARQVHRWASGRERQMRALRWDEHALEQLFVAGREQHAAIRETALGIGTSGDRPVTDVMVPIERVRGLDAKAPSASFHDEFADTRHSRYPLHAGRGEFTGYLYFMDPFLAAEPVEELERFARPLVALEASCTLEDALRSFDSATGRVGLVRDEGAILGFVFATDLVSGLLSMDNPPPRPAGDAA